MATTLSAKKVQSSTGATEKPKKQVTFNDDLFLGGIEGVMRSLDIIKEHETRDTSAAYYDALGTWQETLEKPYNLEFSNAVDAVNSFEAWLSESGWEYVEPVLYTKKGFTITMTMQAASGELSISLDCELSENVELSTAIAAAKAELQTAITKSFPRNSASPSKNGKSTATREATRTEEDEFYMMRVERRNDRIEARLIPSEGKWQQFGVALYPDKAKELGIKIPQKPGEYDMSGSMVYELKPDGKPLRVIEVDFDIED